MNARAIGRHPAVTIGLPVYNGASWLHETLLSLRQQSFDDFEIIISDNSSTDSSFVICQQHAALDSRVRLLRNSVNVGANRNYLAVQAAARARYFKWAACGDVCAPTFLAECIEVLEADPQVVLAAPLTSVFSSLLADATPYTDDFALMEDDAAVRFVGLLRRIKLNNAMNGVVRRVALDRTLPLGVFWGADTLLMAELALLGKFALVPRRLFFRRMAPETATRLRSDQQIEAHLDPSGERKFNWQTWRYCLRLLRIAVRSAPTFPAELRALKEVLRVIVWSRRNLAQELRVQLRQLA